MTRSGRAGTALVVAFTSTIASAQGNFDLDVDLTQLYMWRGLDLLDGTAALQPALTWDRGRNWYLGAWGSLALDRGRGCAEITGDTCWRWDEIDFYAGFYHSWGEESRWQLDWDASLTYFWFMHQDRDLDTVELGLSASFPRIIGTDGPVPYLRYYYNRGARVEGDKGYWLIGGLEHRFALPGYAVGFDINLTYKDGDAGLWSYAGFSNANLSLYLDYPLGSWSLVPALSFQKALTDQGDGIGPEDKVWGNIVFSHLF
jgi:uncharacterized protein (TIGR02001 family)